MGEAVIRRPLMSGHCAVGNTSGHERCQNNGGGQRANPEKMFQPCPCLCHFLVGGTGGERPEVFECGGCGSDIIAAPDWPLDEDEDMRYTHVDFEANRVTGEECTRSAPVSRNADQVRDCVRCGDPVDIVDSRICKDCIRLEQEERDAADDFSDLDDLDDFSDLDDL